MRILIAGATGAIGRPLIRCLKRERHTVFALARSQQSSHEAAESGAESITADALDAASVKAAMVRVRPDVVINELTALPRHYTAAEMKAAGERDRKVRIEGNANLLAALGEARARRYILQSSAFWYAPGAGLADERAPFAFDASPGVAAGARRYAELEAAALGTPDVELVILRYGFFYGPGTWYLREGDMGEQVRRRQVPVIGSGQGVWSFVHIDDAAAATAAALECVPGTYNVADSDPGERRRRLRSQNEGPLRPLVRMPSTMRLGSEAHRMRRLSAS
jgi:nucleoside-diphosphate-sugar epimerase